MGISRGCAWRKEQASGGVPGEAEGLVSGAPSPLASRVLLRSRGMGKMAPKKALPSGYRATVRRASFPPGARQAEVSPGETSGLPSRGVAGVAAAQESRLPDDPRARGSGLLSGRPRSSRPLPTTGLGPK